MPLARAAYRGGQFLRALFPRLGEADAARARSLLDDGEMRLFLSMEKRDQQHGLRVLQHLQSQGMTDRELLAAALLHDCGKGKVPVWLRVAYVLAPAYVEALAAKAAGKGEVTAAYGWRAALSNRVASFEFGAAAAYRLVHHARLGVQLAEQAGSSATTVRYIGGVAADDERAKIALLRAADEAN